MSIYYGTQSVFRVKSYCRSNLLGASVLNFERLDILRDSIGLPSTKLLCFNFLGVSVLNFERLNRLRHSIGHPSTKLLSFNFRRASVLNFERVDILRDLIGLPSEKLLSFEFSTSFGFKFRTSRYVTALNRTSEYKVIVF